MVSKSIFDQGLKYVLLKNFATGLGLVRHLVLLIKSGSSILWIKYSYLHTQIQQNINAIYQNENFLHKHLQYSCTVYIRSSSICPQINYLSFGTQDLHSTSEPTPLTKKLTISSCTYYITSNAIRVNFCMYSCEKGQNIF